MSLFARTQMMFLLAMLAISYSAHAELLGSSLATDITPRKGTSVAGYSSTKRRNFRFKKRTKYAKWFKAHEGVAHPLRAKVMTLKQGEKLLVFVSLDVIGISKRFREDLIQKLAHPKINEESVFIGATHTHSGSGGLAHNPIYQIMAADRFQPKIYKDLLGQVVELVNDSLKKLQPVTLHSLSFETQGLQKNRREKGAYFDPAARLLLLKSHSGQQWVGSLLNYAIHATGLSASNLDFSSDIPGAIEEAVESVTGAPSLFFQGAVGDVGPIHKKEKGLEKTKRLFKGQLLSNLENVKILKTQWSVKTLQTELGIARFRSKACINNSTLEFLFGFIAIPFKRFFPKHTELSMLKIDDQMLFTVPGEITASLGQEISNTARDNGLTPWVLGLTNDYLSYFTSDSEFQAGGSTSACTSLYGRKAGPQIVNTFKQALQ